MKLKRRVNYARSNSFITHTLVHWRYLISGKKWRTGLNIDSMISFVTTIERFGQQGEKTGWTYILVPSELAQKLQPGSRKGFRVKGKIDQHPFKMISLLPMGGG